MSGAPAQPGPQARLQRRGQHDDESLDVEAVQAYERSHIEKVLKKLTNDKKGAAEALGMSLSSLYRKLEELRIQPE